MPKLLASNIESVAKQPAQRILWNLGGALVGGLLLAFSVLLTYTQSFGQVFVQVGLHFMPFLWTTLFLALLSLMLGLIVKRLYIGFLLTALAAMILTLVNHFKTLITSMPLELFELQLASKLGAITELNSESIHFSAATVVGLLVPIIWFVVLLVLNKPLLRLKWKHALLSAAGSLCVFLLCFLLGTDTLVYAPAGISLNEDVPQGQVYESCSVPLGLWRSLIYRDSKTGIDINDKDALEQLMGNLAQGSQSTAAPSESPVTSESVPPAEESSAPGESLPPPEEEPVESESAPPGQEVIAPVVEDKRPNVILILSESFFDVTTLESVEFESDPLKEFHALQKEGVYGRFFSRTTGYGTCNVELEILTGINSQLLEKGDDPLHWEPEANAMFGPVPALMQGAGYYTAFLHMFNDNIYNRTKLFSTMGFDDMFFTEDFAQIDPDAADASDYYSYLNSRVSGYYYSDKFMTELIIDLYEKKEKDGPVFLYASSMENHSPYRADKYGKCKYSYTTTPELSEGAKGALDSYVEGVSRTSKALRNLVDYFSRVDEPTVILFFGDHVPGLNTDTTTVYHELDFYFESFTTTSPELVKELYSSDYLIWANDPSLLPQKAGTQKDTSSGFFGLEVLKAADIPLSRYWLLVDAMQKECQAYNRVYFIDANGNPSWKPGESTNMEPFEQMAAILADGKKDKLLTDWICEVP